MAYNNEEILRRLRLGEDSAWEFKQVEFNGDRPSSPRRDDWADEIAAFANASGGTLLCGVSDAGEVQGMSRQQITNLDALLVETCTDSIRPPVRISTHHIEFEGGSWRCWLKFRRATRCMRPRAGATYGSARPNAG